MAPGIKIFSMKGSDKFKFKSKRKASSQLGPEAASTKVTETTGDQDLSMGEDNAIASDIDMTDTTISANPVNSQQLIEGHGSQLEEDHGLSDDTPMVITEVTTTIEGHPDALALQDHSEIQQNQVEIITQALYDQNVSHQPDAEPIVEHDQSVHETKDVKSVDSKDHSPSSLSSPSATPAQPTAPSNTTDIVNAKMAKFDKFDAIIANANAKDNPAQSARLALREEVVNRSWQDWVVKTARLAESTTEFKPKQNKPGEKTGVEFHRHDTTIKGKAPASSPSSSTPKSKAQSQAEHAIIQTSRVNMSIYRPKAHSQPIASNLGNYEEAYDTHGKLLPGGSSKFAKNTVNEEDDDYNYMNDGSEEGEIKDYD